MKQYHQLLRHILNEGVQKPPSRKNMPGTLSHFGYQFRHNLGEGFPLLTTKKVSFKNIVVELLWFLRGNTNIKYLLDNGVNIWNQDAYRYYLKKWEGVNSAEVEKYEYEEFIDRLRKDLPVEPTNGDCGYQYGRTWRNLEGYIVDDRPPLFDSHHKWVELDQFKRVIKRLREKPYSRRNILSSVSPLHDQELALYWCHTLCQFNVRPGEDGKPKYLDLQLYQRSGDVFLGVPYNIASYALLLEIVAALCGLQPGEFIHTFGDVHIYDNHRDAVKEQLSRNPKKYNLPTVDLPLNINEKVDVDDSEEFQDFIESLHWSDFLLEGYESYPAIKAELKTGLNLKQK